MGSGEIAVPALAAMAACAALELVCIITQPDKKQGRKRQLQPTPVGAWCDANGRKVLKPASVNKPDCLSHLESLNLDLILVFAFGQILKDQLLKLPRLGCVNMHASLLPLYRGAAPVNAAILNGDSETGISIMQMTRGLDEGPVFARHSLALGRQETAQSLEARLADFAARIACPSIKQIASGELQATPQDVEAATYAPKITKADGVIDWTQPADAIERQIRGYYPWPGAKCRVDTGKGDLRLTITEAIVIDTRHNEQPGTLLRADKHGWIIACGQHALRLDRVIPEGRKEMTGIEFVRGRPLLKVLPPEA